MKRGWIPLLFVIAGIISILAVGCGGGGGANGEGRGTLAIRMADAPDPTITSVVVDVDKVEANTQNGWVLITDQDQSIDLMDLVLDDMLLGQSLVRATHYSQIRLILTGGTVTDSQGTHPLVIPSGEAKINLHFDVPRNQIVVVLLDFNVHRSLHKLGNGVYHLKPVIPAVLQVISGSISGTVTNASGPVNNATVHAFYTAGPNYPIGDLIAETFSLPDGRFKVWALKAGTYRLEFTWTDPANPAVTMAATVNDVAVTAMQDTTVGIVTIQ